MQGWMVSELKLSGNEAIVYALIYSYSRDGISEFSGTQAYVAEWCNIAREAAGRVMKRLEEKGLIKRLGTIREGKSVRIRYRAIVPELCDETSHTTGEQCDETSLDSVMNHHTDKYINNNTPSPRARVEKAFDFRSALLELGIEPEVVDDWIKIRAERKGINSETAFRAIRSDIQRCVEEFRAVTPTDCIRRAVIKGWRGFEYSWFANWYNDEQKQGNNGRTRKNSGQDLQFGGYGEGTI